MVRRRRSRGFTMFEAAIALVVVTAIATTVAVTGTSQLRFFARSHEETVAGRAAMSRIERVAASAEALAEGTSVFAIDGNQLREAAGSQTVVSVEPGLLRVEAEVTWQAADGGTGTVRLATLVAVEAKR